MNIFIQIFIYLFQENKYFIVWKYMGRRINIILLASLSNNISNILSFKNWINLYCNAKYYLFLQFLLIDI